MNRTKINQCTAGSTPVESVQTFCRSNDYALRVEYVETARLKTYVNVSPCHVLGMIHHDRSPEPDDSGVCPAVYLDLPQFNQPPVAEVWTSTLPVTYHRADGIHCAMNNEVLFGAVHMEEPAGTPLEIVTYNAYQRLLVRARVLGYAHLLRVWNYFPHINRESDGLERYQRFCVGRHQALAERLMNFPRSLPAATAIGTMSGPLCIHFLATKQPGTHIENPRQVRAYEYPPSYGPSSPSFARATLSGPHLLISGTASVVGHMSLHICDPHKQTLEILHNLNALLGHTEQLHGVIRGQWNRDAFFKIYIRHPEHYATVRDILKKQLPSHARVLYLHGEMSRSELLVEVEGALSQEQVVAASRSVLPKSIRFQKPSTAQYAQGDRIKIV